MSDLLDPVSYPEGATPARTHATGADPADPGLDLIRRHDAEIVSAEAWLTALNQQVATVKGLLADLNRERSALVTMARRSGVEAPAGAGPRSQRPSWTEMPRVQAVQQVLDDAPGPLHLLEMEAVLRSHGRVNDGVSLISATLAYLKRRRGSVRSVGGGRWETCLPASPRGASPVRPPRTVPSITDL